MENISLVLADLDGTLLHDNKTVSAYTKQVVSEVQKKGILFGIATSRARVNAEKLLGGISPDVMITNGGALAVCRGKKVYSCEFSVEEVRLLIGAVFKIFGADAVFSVDNENSLYSNSKELMGDGFWTFTDFSDFCEPAMKLCIETLDRSKVAAVASVLKSGRVDFLPFSDIPWYKLSRKDALKEKAVEALCRHMGLSASKVAAFGDDFADIGMLRACGTGVAMQNAIPQVKAAADELCASNENDGVARWMAERLLGA